MGKLFVGIAALIASVSFFTPVDCHKNHAASTEKSIFLGEGKSVFFKGMASGRLMTVQWMALYL